MRSARQRGSPRPARGQRTDPGTIAASTTVSRETRPRHLAEIATPMQVQFCWGMAVVAESLRPHCPAAGIARAPRAPAWICLRGSMRPTPHARAPGVVTVRTARDRKRERRASVTDQGPHVTTPPLPPTASDGRRVTRAITQRLSRPAAAVTPSRGERKSSCDPDGDLRGGPRLLAWLPGCISRRRGNLAMTRRLRWPLLVSTFALAAACVTNTTQNPTVGPDGAASPINTP